MLTGAVFSRDRVYRTELFRIWDEDVPPLCFIGMNPSIADAMVNDQTVERMMRRAMMGKHGGLLVANVFSIVDTYSKNLPQYIADGVDIVGPDNDAAIIRLAKRSSLVICGWGVPGNLNGRGEQVLALLRAAGVKPKALAFNIDGSPQHPLYLGYDVEPIDFPAAEGDEQQQS